MRGGCADECQGQRQGVACSQVSIHFFTKTSVQRTAFPATIVDGSPIATISAPLPNHVVVPSHSGATIPFVPRKRKAIAPNTSATCSERSSSINLIENVDMGELIEVLMKTKLPFQRTATYKNS